jgi:hypothetical protein
MNLDEIFVQTNHGGNDANKKQIHDQEMHILVGSGNPSTSLDAER